MISQPNESACLLKFGTHVCQTSKQGRVKLQKAPATRTSAENIFTDCVRRDQQQDLRIACDAISSKNLRIAAGSAKAPQSAEALHRCLKLLSRVFHFLDRIKLTEAETNCPFDLLRRKSHGVQDM